MSERGSKKLWVGEPGNQFEMVEVPQEKPVTVVQRTSSKRIVYGEDPFNFPRGTRELVSLVVIDNCGEATFMRSEAEHRMLQLCRDMDISNEISREVVKFLLKGRKEEK